MDPNLAVQIYASFKEDPDKGEAGTGYPIGNGLVITARHIIENFSENFTIELLWSKAASMGFPEDSREWQSANIFWDCEDYENSKGLDVLVLKTNYPDLNGRKHGVLSPLKADINQQWTSAGFPILEKETKDVKGCSSFSGKMYPSDDDQIKMKLTVDNPPKIKNEWRGMSGGVICCDNFIYGVIIETVTERGKQHLYATPSWKILQDGSLEAKILADHGYYDNDTINKNLDDKKESILNMVKVHEKLNEEFMKNILSSNVGDFLDYVYEIILKWDGRGWPKHIEKKTMKEELFSIVHHLFPKGSLNWFVVQKLTSSVSGISPAAALLSAEAAMSFIDDRSLDVTRDDKKCAKPRLAIPEVPASSLDNFKSVTLSGLREHLYAEHCKNIGENGNDEVKDTFTNRGILDKIKRSKTPYYVFEIRKHENYVHIKSDIDCLKSKYPGVFFIPMSSNNKELLQQEKFIRVMGNLLDILDGDSK